MTPEEQRAWIMKYDDPPSCPHGIMIGCRVCADANASPAEGEVTTGEAELRKPDGYAYRYKTYFGDCIMFNGGEEYNLSKPIETIPYWLGTPPESANASLRAKLEERDADAERYRWLRDHHGNNRVPHITQYPYCAAIDDVEHPYFAKVGLDAAVDAAMPFYPLARQSAKAASQPSNPET